MMVVPLVVLPPPAAPNPVPDPDAKDNIYSFKQR